MNTGKEHGCLVTTNCYNKRGTVTDLHAELILHTFSINKHNRCYKESNTMHLVVRMFDEDLRYSLLFKLPSIHDHENSSIEWDNVPPTLASQFKSRKEYHDLHVKTSSRSIDKVTRT